MSPASQSTSSAPQGSWSHVMEGVESKAQLEGQHSQIMSENEEKDSKNTDKSATPIKTQHLDSSTSTPPQVATQGLESSFPIPSDSKSESPVKNDAILKVKETKVNEPKVLLKKISTLEKEQLSLKKRIQDLTDENAFLESENASVPEFKRMISEASRRMKAMVGVLEASRQQVLTLDEENKRLKHELSSKESEVTKRFQKQFDEQEVRNLELHEKVAELAKRNEQITELKAKIDLLNNSHATEEEKWNAEIENLKTELREKCDIVDDLNEKHDHAMSCLHGLKLKVMEMDVCLHSSLSVLKSVGG